MQALHMMADILTQNPTDQSAIPLSLAGPDRGRPEAPGRQVGVPPSRDHLPAVSGDVASSVQSFNQAFNLDPTDEAITTQFIDTLRSAGDKDNAMKVAEFAAEKGNESPKLMARIGSLLIEDDKFDESEPFLRRAVDEGKVPSAFGDLANVLWDRADGDNNQGKEDRAEAMKLLETAVAQSAHRQVHAGHAAGPPRGRRRREGHQAAARSRREALGQRDGAALRRIDVLWTETIPSKAGPFLQQILELPRRSLDDDAFARRGQLDAGGRGLRRPVRRRHRTGAFGRCADQAKEAAVFLREVIGKDEKFWQPHLMLALAVRETEGDGAALAHLMSAVRLRPNDAEIRNLIAAILRKQGRPKEAVEHLRAVVALNPREVEPVVSPRHVHA